MNPDKPRVARDDSRLSQVVRGGRRLVLRVLACGEHLRTFFATWAAIGRLDAT